VPVPTYRDRPATVATDPIGTDLEGVPCRVPVVATGWWSLVVFLSSGCHGCRDLWQALEDPVRSGLVGDESVVVVTRDAEEEDVDALRGLARGPVPVVMSTATWSAYCVQGPPFFSLVDGRVATQRAGPEAVQGSEGEPMAPGPLRVVTEGVAWGVAQVAADVRRARRRAEGS
jgi:hypothetical protein